jgi:hypothetical protein
VHAHAHARPRLDRRQQSAAVCRQQSGSTSAVV